MLLKSIGAVLILGSCTGIGCSIVAGYRQEEAMLQSFLRILSRMECELQYRLTPLPELCRQASREANRTLRGILLCFSRELEAQCAPEASGCMKIALQSREGLPKSVRQCLHQLGGCLGRYDLSGQLQGLQEVRARCAQELNRLQENREQRMRSCQTLSLCAGAALVILFI